MKLSGMRVIGILDQKSIISSCRCGQPDMNVDPAVARIDATKC